MNFFKAIFWLVVLFFNISLFKASETAGIIFVIIEVAVYVKLKMGKSSSNSSFRSNPKGKHFGILYRQPVYTPKTDPVDVILKLMQIESGNPLSNSIYRNGSQSPNYNYNYDYDYDYKGNFERIHYLSQEHKIVVEILSGKSGKDSISNNILTENPLINQIVLMYKNKDFLGIAKLFMQLLIIHLRSLMFQVIDYTGENLTVVRLLKWVGNILLKKYGIDFILTKINRIQEIEGKIKDFSNSNTNLDQNNSMENYRKITSEDCKFIANLFFSIKDLNPMLLNPETFKMKNKNNSRNDSDLISENSSSYGNNGTQKTGKILASKNLMNGIYLSNNLKNLKKLDPLVKLVSLDSKRRKSKGFSSKGFSLRSKSNSNSNSNSGNNEELIPESVSGIVKEYIEDKFNEEVFETMQNINQTGDLNAGIETMRALEETRSSMSSNFTLKLPSDRFVINSAMNMSRFLTFFSIFIALIGFIIICQIFYLPDATSIFLSFGLVFLGSAGLSFYVSKKL